MVELSKIINHTVKVNNKKYSSMISFIPKKIRRELKWKVGDTLSWEQKNNSVEVKKHE